MITATFDDAGWMWGSARLPHGVSESTVIERACGLFLPRTEARVVSTRAPELPGTVRSDAPDSAPRRTSEVQAPTFKETPAQATSALVRTLLDYAHLPNDWDGYGGLPAHPHALMDAVQFVQNMPADLPLPAPMLAGSGAVGLYWDRGTHYASIEFEGDNTYTYLTDGPEGYGGAEGVPATLFAPELQRYLQAMLAAE